MHLPLFATSVLLFLSMLVPLPSPVGLAIALWALAEGVPIPVVLGMYVFQDLLSFAAMRRVIPPLADRAAARIMRLPAWANRPLRPFITPGKGCEVGLFSAALISFYAGAALAAVTRSGPYRSGAIVIGTDLLKYLNGLFVAIGAVHLLPSTPWTIPAASLAGLAVTPLFRTIAARRRLAAVPVRVQRLR